VNRLAAILLLALAVASPALAGGPALLWRSGQPYVWPDGGAAIPYNPDRGPLGTIPADEMPAYTADAFGRWEAIPTATAAYVNAGFLPEDVDETNFGPYFSSAFPDGLSIVVYDEDGSIFDLLYGPGSAILGVSAPEWGNAETGEIQESLAFFNGRWLLEGLLSEEDFFGVLVHEFGHYVNLTHTVVNGQIALNVDATGPSPHDTFPPESLYLRIETMYPFKFINGGDETPHPDDVAAFSSLYPAPDFHATTGSITGHVYGPDGIAPLTGVNVIARNIADPFDDAVSGLTSSLTVNFSRTDPFTGAYTLNGLTPGETYAIFIDELESGRFLPPPLNPLPGPEEFYNGENESSDPDTDDPAVFTGVTVTAGEPAEGVDIVLNRLPPGPLPLGDDSSIPLFPRFPVSFCGHEYDLLWVNANGTITFGQDSPIWLEKPFNMLAGPPRIAGLWDDLNPTTRGLVSFDETPNAFTVRFEDVPEWRQKGANSFEITLHRASRRLDLSYGGLTAPDGMAGYGCGGFITSGREKEIDLTELKRTSEGTVNGRNETALYEWFLEGENDLENSSVSFTLPDAFKDSREPNDTIQKATRVQLPFDSSSLFTEIAANGSDVDTFRFRAEAGKTLIAETRPGNPMDTVLGLFDVKTGELLAVADDGGRGLLSRLVYPVAEDGLYAVAVSTYPDLELDGGGEGWGRYVVTVRTVDDVLLEMGDDDSMEIELETFTFPFQGEEWTSFWLNSNGNLTFGQLDPFGFDESLDAFLEGPPRIAPLWDDLSPDQGGTITLERTADSLTIRFLDVPEYFEPFGNTFAVTLRASGEIVLQYEETAGNDGLVGITGGNGADDPGATDLSETDDLSAAGTTYELFGVGELDLDSRTLVFRAP
jgi:hypothetical protein